MLMITVSNLTAGDRFTFALTDAPVWTLAMPVAVGPDGDAMLPVADGPDAPWVGEFVEAPAHRAAFVLNRGPIREAWAYDTFTMDVERWMAHRGSIGECEACGVIGPDDAIAYGHVWPMAHGADGLPVCAHWADSDVAPRPGTVRAPWFDLSPTVLGMAHVADLTGAHPTTWSDGDANTVLSAPDGAQALADRVRLAGEAQEALAQERRDRWFDRAFGEYLDSIDPGR